MGNSPSAAPIPAARGTCRLFGSASFYDTPGRLSPIRAGLRAVPLFGLFRRLFGVFRPPCMRRVPRPEVRSAFPREPLGLAAAPVGDLGMVPGGQHVRDRMALPELGAGKLRVFEQALGEALLLPRRLLAHDA